MVKRNFLFVIFLFATIYSNAQQTLNVSMLHDGVTREYIVYVPAVYNGSSSVPLLFNFHGYGMSANNQMSYGNMRAVADTAGFILVYPQGTLFWGSPHWNVGSWTLGSTADDIGFTEAMIDTLAANYNIDLNRVYSCGYSNGGYFSFVLACQLSAEIAAIGSVGGTMSTETYNSCNPSHPTPVVTIHGTDDATVSYSGGNPNNSESLSDVNTYWANYNNTIVPPVVSNLPNINATDGSTVELSLFDNGDNCTSVEHYKVIGGDHDWPGSWGNMDINADAVIWSFVSKYDLNGLIGCATTSINENNNTQENYKIYPNPVHTQITIDLGLAVEKEFRLYNPIGELVLTGVLNSQISTIDLSSLPPNVYVLNIENQSTRLIKTK
ncbi:MAG: T9SS type A sorting domain-containing protein [Pelagibacterales bacterium]|nr:T9SS type A sorting domain-containing protein [Pelagibacterales bacterium]